MGKATLKAAFAEFRADDMPTWAAGLTYYAVLSLFPALLVFVALIGLVGEYPQTSDAILDVVRDIGPASAVDTLQGTIEGVVQRLRRRRRAARRQPARRDLVGVGLHRRLHQGLQRDLRGRGGPAVQEAQAAPARR